MSRLENKLNSSLPVGELVLNFATPGQVLFCSFNDLVGR